MVLLMAFALLAGAGTALSPCVLPVLPAVLSAGVTGGRRRPLGVVTGLVVSFMFAVVALVYVIQALGLPDDLLRNVAIGVLFAFGITLLIPPLSDRIEAAISRAVPGPRGGAGDGFGSGFLLFNAKQAFLVLGSPVARRPLRVELDGKPIPNQLAGQDVRNGVARIGPQRLYRLVDLPAVGRHRLTLRFAPGISGYAFTFG